MNSQKFDAINRSHKERLHDFTKELPYTNPIDATDIVTESREYIPHNYILLKPVEDTGAQNVEIELRSNEHIQQRNHDAMPFANSGFNSEALNTEELIRYPSSQQQLTSHNYHGDEQRYGNNLSANTYPQMVKSVELKNVSFKESCLKNIPSLPEYIRLNAECVQTDEQCPEVFQPRNPNEMNQHEYYEDISPPDEYPQAETYIDAPAESEIVYVNNNYQLLPSEHVARNKTIMHNIEPMKNIQSLHMEQPNTNTRPGLNPRFPSIANKDIGIKFVNDSMQTSQPKLNYPRWEVDRRRYELLTQSTTTGTTPIENAKNTQYSEPEAGPENAQHEETVFQTPQQKFAYLFGLKQQKYARMAYSNNMPLSKSPPHSGLYSNNERSGQPVSSNNGPTNPVTIDNNRQVKKYNNRSVKGDTSGGKVTSRCARFKPPRLVSQRPARPPTPPPPPPLPLPLPLPPPPPPPQCYQLQTQHQLIRLNNPNNLNHPVVPFNNMHNNQQQQLCCHPGGMHYYYCGYPTPNSFTTTPYNMSQEQLLHHMQMHHRSYEFLLSVLSSKTLQH